MTAKIKSPLPAVIDKVQRMLSSASFASGGVVALETGDNGVRAVMVEKSGKRAIISRVVYETDTGNDNTDPIGRLPEMDNHLKGPAVLVTDHVKFLASEINVEGVDRLPQEKLNAAAMWEIEPYLDFPPAEGLFTCRLQHYLKRDEATPALIFAMDKNGYVRLADRLKTGNLDLRRMYSPEGALARAVRPPAAGNHKVVIDCRSNALKGVLLATDGPAVFQDLPLADGGLADEESVRGMIYDLTATVGGIEAIVLSGETASPALVDALQPEFDNLRIWDSSEAGDVEAGDEAADMGPAYASVLGAALQELKMAGDAPLGVTDRVPITTRITQRFRENKRLAPALTAALLLAFLIGHFSLTQASIGRYHSRIDTLEAEKRKLLRPRQEKERLEKKLAQASRKQAYLETVLAAGNNNLLALLGTISTALPRDVVLNRLYQKRTGSYWIEGNAYLGRSVYAFNESLSRTQGCTSTNLETIRRVEQPSDTRQKLLPYEFTINVNF